MATIQWRGDAPAVAQVDTIEVTDTWTTGDVAEVTINDKTVAVTVGTDATPRDVAEILYAALVGNPLVGDETREGDGSAIPELQELTIELHETDPLITFTGRPGVPFAIAASETVASDGDLDHTAEVFSATGPNDIANAANWSGGALPTNGDHVYFDDSSIDALYNLTALTSVTLGSLTVTESYRGRIGLPRTNSTGGSSPYIEYRPQYLKVGATSLVIRSPSSRIKIDTGTVQSAVFVFDSGQPENRDVPTILWMGTNASNTVDVVKGSFGAAVHPGETATIATLRINYRDNVDSDAQVHLGSGVTLTNVAKSGGQLVSYCGGTSLTQHAGRTFCHAGAWTTITTYGGPVIYNSTGTLGTGNTAIDGSAVIDFSQDMRPKTVTNPINKYGPSGGANDPHNVVNPSGNFVIDCEQSEAILIVGNRQVSLGRNVKLTRSLL